MKESYGEGLAAHTGPESCPAVREALTGVRDLALSPEARAGCGNPARPDPWRGLWATINSYSDPSGVLHRSFPPVPRSVDVLRGRRFTLPFAAHRVLRHCHVACWRGGQEGDHRRDLLCLTRGRTPSAARAKDARSHRGAR